MLLPDCWLLLCFQPVSEDFPNVIDSIERNLKGNGQLFENPNQMVTKLTMLTKKRQNKDRNLIHCSLCLSRIRRQFYLKQTERTTDTNKRLQHKFQNTG